MVVGIQRVVNALLNQAVGVAATPGPRLSLVAVKAPTSVVLPNTTCSVVSLPPVGGRICGLFSLPQVPPKKAYKRPERVADQIVIEVADILTRKAADPRILGVSVIRADVSPDLCQATIYVSRSYGEQKALQGLAKASGFIRSELARRMSLKRVPALTFESAQTFDKVSHLLELIEQVEEEDKGAKSWTEPSPDS